jgi:hypothetical protein
VTQAVSGRPLCAASLSKSRRNAQSRTGQAACCLPHFCARPAVTTSRRPDVALLKDVRLAFNRHGENGRSALNQKWSSNCRQR